MVADFNEDGKTDVLYGGGGCEMHLGDGTRPWTASTWTNCPASQLTGGDAVDVDGDGHLDLVTAEALMTGSLVQVELGDGAGHFSTEVDYPLPSGGVGGVAVGDFDGNGTMDVAVNQGQSLAVELGDGHGHFGVATSYPVFVCCDSEDLLAADVNGDGKDDLFMVHPLKDDVGVLFASGESAFLFETDYAVGRWPTSFVTGDFNHDGNVDVAAADWESSDVVVLDWTACGGGVPAGFRSGPDADAGSDASVADSGDADLVSDGAACEASGPCSGTCQTDGRCLVTMASSLVSPEDIAVDGTRVYWTTEGASATSGTVSSLPKNGAVDGGGATTLAGGLNFPFAIAVNGANVYWTDANGRDVMSVPLAGGTATTLATGQDDPDAIALDGTNVYWSDYGGSILQTPLGGGPVTTLSSGQIAPWSIAAAGGSVYWGHYGSTSYTSYSIFDLSISSHTGSSVATLANVGNPARQGMVADASNLYFTDNGSVYSVPLGGGTVATLVSTQSSPSALTVDSANVYWVDTGPFGEILRMPLTGGPVTTLASSQPNPGGIAVDGTSVYWVNGGTSASSYSDGVVQKLTPK